MFIGKLFTGCDAEQSGTCVNCMNITMYQDAHMHVHMLVHACIGPCGEDMYSVSIIILISPCVA